MMRFAILSLLISLGTRCCGWEPYTTDVTQETMVEYRPEPDHLEPTSSGPPRGHWYLIQCCVHDAFDAPWIVEVSLSSNKTYGVVELYVPDKSAESGWTMQKRTTIPLDVAASLYATWVNTLLETRYSRYSHKGLDGVSYVFSACVRGLGCLNGQTWSPEADAPPWRLVEITYALRKLVDGPEKQQVAFMVIKDNCLRVMAYLKKNAIMKDTSPWKEVTKKGEVWFVPREPLPESSRGD